MGSCPLCVLADPVSGMAGVLCAIYYVYGYVSLLGRLDLGSNRGGG